jgi:uncharacterized protein YkwD
MSAPAPAASVERESASPALTPVEEIEQRVFALTNERRAAARVGRLAPDADLSLAARRHSEDMLRRRFFSHVGPDGRGPADRVRRITGLSQTVGENIWSWAGGTRPPSSSLAAQAIAAWMASRPHRQNMLRARYRTLGVGAAIGPSDVRITQVFRE